MSDSQDLHRASLASSEQSSLHVKRRLDVDGLRGIAVVAVVLYHFFPNLVPGGFVGVDIFFVISGFVITNLLIRQQPFSGRALLLFWGHRVRRLFPALFIVILFTLIAGWLVLWPAQFRELGESAAWSAAMLGNVYAFTKTGYFNVDPAWNPLLNLWSLGVEEQFYLVWPALFAALWLICRRRRVAIFWVILALLFVSWVWGLTYSVSGFELNATSATFYLPWFRAWELLAGAVVALLINKVRGRIGGGWAPSSGRVVVNRTSYIVSFAVLIAALMWPYTSERPSVYALAVVLATSLIIYLGTEIVPAQRLVGNPPLLWLGKLSYPLYLWHWPVLVIGAAAGFSVSFFHKSGLILGSFVLAWLTWRFIETPTQRRPVTWNLVAGLISLMVLVGALGWGLSKVSMTRVTVSDLAAQLDVYNGDPERNYGNPDCFIEGGDGQDPNGLEACLPENAGEPRVLLWGDSHAATMVYGLDLALTTGSVAQLTIAGCEPSLPEDAPNEGCNVQNELALEEIKSGNVKTVILAGWWRDQYDPQDLVKVVEGIQEVSSAQIVVVGPLPRWSPALPRIWSPAKIATMEYLPIYTKQGLMPEPFELDTKIKVALAGTGAMYVSALDSLCTSQGCRVSVDGNPSSLTAWDYGHLTKAGSELLGDSIVARIQP